jgi:hypothetical protein
MAAGAPCVFLHRRPAPGGGKYPMRVLLYNNICIDETRQYTNRTAATQSATNEAHPLGPDMTRDADALVAAHAVFMEAKAAYERATAQFWSTPTGDAFQAILAPDPSELDRAILASKTRELDARLSTHAVGGIRYRNVEYSGYNRIVAKYVFIMYEVQDPPRFFNDFVLQTLNVRVFDEIPKVWTNKMALERKKEVELVYVCGRVEPPYRLADARVINVPNVN